MKIYVVLKSYRTYERPFDMVYFKKLYSRCQQLGINMKSANRYLKDNKGKFAIITLPERNLDEHSERNIKLDITDQLMIGYAFVTSFPSYRHLTLKTVVNHFEELIIKQNTTLLKQLYEYEKDIYSKVIH
jgi:hypothetical protein